jgi:hypothetical protein
VLLCAAAVAVLAGARDGYAWFLVAGSLLLLVAWLLEHRSARPDLMALFLGIYVAAAVGLSVNAPEWVSIAPIAFALAIVLMMRVRESK